MYDFYFYEGLPTKFDSLSIRIEKELNFVGKPSRHVTASTVERVRDIRDMAYRISFINIESNKVSVNF